MKASFSTLFALAILLGTSTAQAQTYPTKPITIVVTAAAGGVSDVIARAIGQRLQEAWGQQVVVENRGGGAHILGAGAVAKATPDGHTLLVAESGTFVLNPTLYPKDKLPYDVDKDFAPVTGLIRVNQALIASNNLPATNVGELITLAKSKPGSITYATAGIGSAPHVNLVKLENFGGVKLQPVHYRGAAPAVNDIIAGHVNLMSVSVSSVLQQFRAGQLKILGIGSEKRIPQAPDVPTVAEAGLPGYTAQAWFGLVTTGGTPPAVVAKLNAEVRRALSDPEFQKKFMEPQMFESMATDPDAFAQYIKSETQLWAKIIREQNLQIEPQ
jgi:tripartite-type tricarboxylate transporter receptor subunit TctC